MADLFDKLSQKVVEATDFTREKAKTVAKIAKLTVDLKAKEADLADCYERIGRLLFMQVKHSKKNDEKIDSLIEKADLICTEMYSIKRRIAKLKDAKICKYCGAFINKNEQHCTECGQKIVANEAASSPKKDKE